MSTSSQIITDITSSTAALGSAWGPSLFGFILTILLLAFILKLSLGVLINGVKRVG